VNCDPTLPRFGTDLMPTFVEIFGSPTTSDTDSAVGGISVF
jgi:hypothetical protein